VDHGLGTEKGPGQEPQMAQMTADRKPNGDPTRYGVSPGAPASSRASFAPANVLESRRAASRMDRPR
jgi:hypothetical protein